MRKLKNKNKIRANIIRKKYSLRFAKSVFVSVVRKKMWLKSILSASRVKCSEARRTRENLWHFRLYVTPKRQERSDICYRVSYFIDLHQLALSSAIHQELVRYWFFPFLFNLEKATKIAMYLINNNCQAFLRSTARFENNGESINYWTIDINTRNWDCQKNICGPTYDINITH